MTRPTRVLLVDDERDVSEPLASRLEREGFEVTVGETLEEARGLLRDSPEMVLLDLRLPDGSGLDLCREIRNSSSVPIIMLTAAADEADRVVGLELGADDYVAKPFSARELVARMRAVLRRVRSRSSGDVLQDGDIRLDPRTRTVTRAGNEVPLTAKEFDLLAFLMSRSGEVVRREEIMDEVWDPHWFGPTKTLDVHIASLRKKLEHDPSAPQRLVTVRGIGYRFVPEANAAA